MREKEREEREGKRGEGGRMVKPELGVWVLYITVTQKCELN